MTQLDPKAMARALREAAILATKPYLSITEAAEILGVSRPPIDRLILAGRLNAYRPDPTKRKIVLKRDEIDQAVTSGRVIPVAPFED